MKYLKIQNNGELDIRLVALMGGTTKSNNQYKIGQFGTGLKYTLAFLYRNNLDFKIYSGIKQVNLHLESETIKDEVFDIICINNQRTSITTRMGEDWTAWMIIRELWCNALDEGGASFVETDSIQPIVGTTMFYIQIDRQISDVLKKWDKYFIHNQTPIFTDGTYSLYPPSDKLRIYKHGVLIYEDPNAKSLFSYDVAHADINELREFRGSVSCAIAMALHRCNEKGATIFLENITEEYYEGKMDYDWWTPSWSPAWTNVIGTGKLIYQKIIDDAAARGKNINDPSLIIVPKTVYTALTKQFDGIGALYTASTIGDFYESYEEATEKKVKQGLTILEHCGYIIHPELQFKYGFFEDKLVEARIDLKEKIIYVSNTMVSGSLFPIIGMLIEENEHFNTGMSDTTREFQQHFIDMYTKELLSKHGVEI